jgi:hypothetical protein
MPTFHYIDEVLPNVFASVIRRPYSGEGRKFATTTDLQTDILWRRNCLFIYLSSIYFTSSFTLLFVYVFVIVAVLREALNFKKESTKMPHF